MPSSNFTPNLSRKVLALVGSEATYNTSTLGGVGTPQVTGATSKALLIFDEMNPIQVDTTVVDMAPVRGSFSKFKSLIGRQLYNVNFKTEVTNAFGSPNTGGTASYANTNTPPFFAPLLKACGMAQVASAAGSSPNYGSVTYTPVSSGFASACSEIYLDGLFHSVTGLYGNCKFEATAGQGFSVSFEMKGNYAAPVAATLPASVVYPEDKKRLVATESLTITPSGGSAYTPIIRSFSMDCGVETIERTDMNSSRGFYGLAISDRKPTVEMTIEVDVFANGGFNPHLYLADPSTGVSTTLGIAFVHGTQPNSVKFSIPQCQLTNVQYQDDNGIRTYQLSAAVVSSTDDSDWTITFCGA